MKSVPTLAFGIFLVLLALIVATGAVSLGSTTVPTGGGQESQITSLVYSPWVFLFSIAMAGVGIGFAYLAGRDARDLLGTATRA